MASRPPSDFIDYVDDETQDEDDTPFFPVRPATLLDTWSGFFGGILIGLAGGALIPLAPWLGGLMVFAGYGMTALTLSGSRNRFARALSFGFGILALAGGIMLLGTIFFPAFTWSFVAAAAQHHVVFVSVAALAWVIGVAKYIYGRLAA